MRGVKQGGKGLISLNPFERGTDSMSWGSKTNCCINL